MIANKNLKEQTDKQVKKTTQGVMDGDQPLTPSQAQCKQGRHELNKKNMSNERETDTDTLFIVKATDPHTNGGGGGGGGGRGREICKNNNNNTHS